jgi:glycosyltransferase involved in cell wall biosynthesis
MKIMVFNKDHPKLSSGYAKCLREIWVKRLAKEFDIAIYATVPHLMFFDEYEGVKVYTNMSENPCDVASGRDSLLVNYQNFGANLLFTQVDVFVLGEASRLKKEKLINWMAYVPIDFSPIPSFVFERLKYANRVIPMCEWAEKELRKQLDNVSSYIYHGVDTSIFKPLGESKSSIRNNIPNNIVREDEFLILVIQRNSLTKNWTELLEGIRIFLDSNPDIKTKIYIHAFPKGDFDLLNLINLFGLENNCVICSPFKYYHSLYTEKDLALIYNLGDVNISVGAEGFGLPLIEAMSCGTASIGLDFGAPGEILEKITPELKVKVKDFRFDTSKFVKRPYPSPEDIAKKLEIVASKGSEHYFQKVSKFAQQFSWDSVAEKIKFILKEFESEIK